MIIGPTLIIIIVTVVTSFAAWQRPGLLDAMILRPPAVWRGEAWRLLSHGLIHADGNHLLFNMITLFFFGSVMEQVLAPRIGVAGFVLFYLAGLVVASIPDLLRRRHDRDYASLGASGAVAGVLFAYILLEPWAMLLVFFIPVPAVVFAVAFVAYSLWAEKHARSNLNHGAHLWGAAWGVVFMLALEPSLLPRFLNRLVTFSDAS
ncbi:MAG: rhomboid family intramembrane serine protease [Marinobacter sp.]|uniref:rhomboid family intramembrane serine protease n=1 Tax=Marinobacter sp. TaxID=50741 RepID=UPI00299D6835|nr:rhomboid family intramembrane serine protease [Marinobacter sp.]MDX1635631.1 rhomboid family intramembrane serine protease [Marinobacter sp.]